MDSNNKINAMHKLRKKLKEDPAVAQAFLSEHPEILQAHPRLKKRIEKFLHNHQSATPAELEAIDAELQAESKDESAEDESETPSSESVRSSS